MLNRRLSDYIFYGGLVLIVVLVVFLRFVIIGGLTEKITVIEENNIALQKQIDALEEVVQEDKEVQTSHLYELYDIIPNVYSGTELTYKTVSILESLGIDESDDIQRTVFVNQNITFQDETTFSNIALEYFVVEVQVSFTTMDAEVVNNFIDALYNSDQLFIIYELEHTVPDGENYVEVLISFLAIYDIEMEEES